MDYSSVAPSGTVLAATGIGMFSGATGQLWLLAVAGLILGGAIMVIKARFRRGKTPDDI